ncbi:MAG: NYN domain-containing protein [Actinomycetota bacterium]|nr:NYN domain-containing protein [Actinomycetota bacterium]
MDIPKEVRSSLARALGAFIRDVPKIELPRILKRWRSFRPQALVKHEDELVAALDDDSVRERVLKWLDGKPPLAKGDAELLRIASERREGWERSLQSTTPSKKAAPRPQRGSARSDLQARVERERSKAADAKEELKRLRESSRRGLQAEKKRSADLTKEVATLSRKLDQSEAALERARAEAGRAGDRAERERRRAKSESEKLRAERDEVRSRLREVNKEKREMAQRLRRLESTVKPKAEPRRRTPGREASSRRRHRRPLRPPQGLFEESPQALDQWLEQDGVKLLVDGYNVVKSKRGFKGATLSDQRDRLVQEAARLARKKHADVTIVFDGSEDPAPAGGRVRRPVKVQYSKPPDTADDHLVALLDALPPEPVIVATSDRELQERVGALGATVVTSEQLLALLR